MELRRHPVRRRSTNQRQSGLSLVELLIALVLGLVLITGVLSVYLSSHKTYGVNTAVGQIQENGRAALNFIRVNTRMAGYMGCGATDTHFTNQLNTPASTMLPYNFGSVITGFEANGTAPGDQYSLPAATPRAPRAGAAAAWSPALDPSLPSGSAAYVIPGSDIFAVSISQRTITPSYVTGLGAGANSFTVAANNNSLVAGDLIVISNCVQTAVREATAVKGLTIGTDTGTSAPGNASSLRPALVQNAQVTTASVVAYYVGLGADGAPALFEAFTDTSSASGFSPQEIVPGVENMQVLYGVAPAGSDAPTQYLTAAEVSTQSPALWSKVVSVRVALLLRSATGAVHRPGVAQTYDLLGTGVVAPRDTRLRQIFTATIALRNRLLRP